jgi:hypothetical protein
MTGTRYAIEPQPIAQPAMANAIPLARTTDGKISAGSLFKGRLVDCYIGVKVYMHLQTQGTESQVIEKIELYTNTNVAPAAPNCPALSGLSAPSRPKAP